AVAIRHVRANAGLAQLVDDENHFFLGFFTQSNAEYGCAFFDAWDRLAFCFQGKHGAVNAETKSNTGEILAAQLRHQTVVAATATDARLCSESVVNELEGGLGVVIQSTHHSRLDFKRHLHVVEYRPYGFKVRAALFTQVIEHQRRIGGSFLDLWALVIYRAQWVYLRAVTRSLVQL